MKKLLSILVVLLITTVASATHNRAGEITYVHKSGLTYDIYVTTYTKTSSAAADRCELIIELSSCNGNSWNQIDTIPRINGGLCSETACAHCGEIVGAAVDIKKNVYHLEFTFPGPSCYTVSVNDPNRNDGIMNIPNSVNTTFYVESEIIINSFLGYNSSPILTNPPIDNGCIGSPWQHSPQAIDPDTTDELRYSLVPCSNELGEPMAGYQYPNEVSNCITDELTIDSETGVVTWDSPVCTGEFNICILIEELRGGIVIGSIVRDMQLSIYDCSNNPPVIDPIGEICVLAGDTISQPVRATDEDFSELIDLTATGAPFLYANPVSFYGLHPVTGDTVPSTYVSLDDSGGDGIFHYAVYGGAEVEALLYWETSCDEVRLQPHRVYLKATDNNAQFSMPDFETVDIKVIAPAPENPTAIPAGNNMNLSWSQAGCSDVSGYKIYRKLDSLGWTPDTCETGVPGYTDYEYLTSVGPNALSYTDQGLVHGQQYCYMVVACYSDGAESYASIEFCNELTKDVPVITRVSVNSTSTSTGSDTITWSFPTDLDTLSFVGPYTYRVMRKDSLTGSTSTITSMTDPFIMNLDTFYVDTLINTQELKYYYAIELTANGQVIGETNDASSIFLNTAIGDNRVILTWDEEVPWTNEMYYIYRSDDQVTFTLRDSTTLQAYTDSSLVNGETYCFYVKSRGRYSATGFIDPIINFSQEVCEIPLDINPPCPPVLIEVDGECEEQLNRITWTNPNTTCADDVAGYDLFHAEELGQPLVKVATLLSATDTFFVNDNLSEGIAGCYAVVAVDSAGNMSEQSNSFCVDNCPEYTLPNVFTPGADGMNDLFRPFPYKFVESIDLTIYNRWGVVVFKTTDPDILWDGYSEQLNKPCSDGVYFYICDVNQKRISGIDKKRLSGYLSLIREP